MDNISDTVEHEERSDGADSPDREPRGGSAGEEAKEQLVSEAQVHAPAEGERSYMDTRDRHSSSSSSSSSDDEEEEVKVEEEEVKAEEAEPEPVEVEVVEVNGEAHDGSRRSSSSSASSASPGDPCDDPPRTREEDNAEDGMLMAYTHHDTATGQEETVDYTLKTLESVTLDESSAAPDDPNQPDVALFVKVRQIMLSLHSLPKGLLEPCCVFTVSFSSWGHQHLTVQTPQTSSNKSQTAEYSAF